MPRSRRGFTQGRSHRRITAWSEGPGDSNVTGFSATSQTILGAGLAAAALSSLDHGSFRSIRESNQTDITPVVSSTTSSIHMTVSVTASFRIALVSTSN